MSGRDMNGSRLTLASVRLLSLLVADHSARGTLDRSIGAARGWTCREGRAGLLASVAR
jgi:hypothetical protein